MKESAWRPDFVIERVERIIGRRGKDDGGYQTRRSYGKTYRLPGIDQARRIGEIPERE